MIDAFRKFFQDRMQTPAATGEGEAEDTRAQPPEIRVAACALMLEIAYADNEFSDSERRHLENVLQRHFDLDEETTRELILLADRERPRSVDLFQFTSAIATEYDEAQKLVLLEAMWGLVFADGEVAKHEAWLMRKVAKLLDVRPGFLAEARRRVEAADD